MQNLINRAKQPSTILGLLTLIATFMSTKTIDMNAAGAVLTGLGLITVDA